MDNTTKLKEMAHLVFERNEIGEVFNIKNRYNKEWDYPVGKEVVDTLMSIDNLKVVFIDVDGEVVSNFRI